MKDSAMGLLKSLYRAMARDFLLVVVLILIGHVLVVFSTPFARWVGQPAFASWGLFTGGAFYIAALSHVMRRMFFHPLSMHMVAAEARLSPTGAGLVFLGMCLVLSSFVMMMAGMLRM